MIQPATTTHTNQAPTQREETVFYAALELADPAERQLFLEQACAGDTDLRGAVEELLKAQTDAERFFAEGSSALIRPTRNGSPTGTSSGPGSSGVRLPIEEQIGSRIGRYKLLQKIGEGGCGLVYMAEQQEPVHRRVALKVIKLGMDTRNVIARFEAERQALALMDHENIARVLDAGATETGRPYFVMELVHGVKITDYCDEHQLDTRKRLDLFVRICHAIQHAHQKGIIHRDIKPSNILITLHDGVPVPKVIDFGIAKATEERLTDRTLFTAYGQFVGTPAYMSPEQAEMSGLDVDTRSDIYSLGVLLYELLTGRTPFDSRKLLRSGLDEMRRTLREKEPQRPSTMLTSLQDEELTMTATRRHAEAPRLISQLNGDLDWIVMKALEKDRRRRYETVHGLVMDIRRYLNDEPVSARPPSRVYRFQKLVRRNRVLFAAGGAVGLALVVGLGTSTWLFFMEREARQRAVAAEQQQARLRQEAEQARANEARLRRQAEVREKITHAAVLISQNKYAQADELMSQVVPIHPTVEGAAVLRSLGEWHALRNEWKAAAARFTALLRVDQLDGWDVSTLDYLECGPALIELGDTTGYDRFRRQAIARFGDTSYPVADPVADRIVKVSLLLPAAPSLIQSLAPLAEAAEKSLASTNVISSDNVFQAAWQSLSLALLEYRRGHYANAAAWCRRCLTFPEHNAPRTATARVILALACHRLGQSDAARSELTESRNVIEDKFKTGVERGNGVQGFWFDWVFARILLREATMEIEPKTAY